MGRKGGHHILVFRLSTRVLSFSKLVLAEGINSRHKFVSCDLVVAVETQNFRVFGLVVIEIKTKSTNNAERNIASH